MSLENLISSSIVLTMETCSREYPRGILLAVVPLYYSLGRTTHGLQVGSQPLVAFKEMFDMDRPKANTLTDQASADMQRMEEMSLQQSFHLFLKHFNGNHHFFYPDNKKNKDLFLAYLRRETERFYQTIAWASRHHMGDEEDQPCMLRVTVTVYPQYEEGSKKPLWTQSWYHEKTIQYATLDVLEKEQEQKVA